MLFVQINWNETPSDADLLVMQHHPLCILPIKLVVLQIVYYTKYKYFLNELIKDSKLSLILSRDWLYQIVCFCRLISKAGSAPSSAFNWAPSKKVKSV